MRLTAKVVEEACTAKFVLGRATREREDGRAGDGQGLLVI